LGATLHRYADDAILVCRKSAEQALQGFAAMAIRMGLTLNRDKTRITKLTEGFDVLGFHFVKRRSPSSGKYAVGRRGTSPMWPVVCPCPRRKPLSFYPLS
jgi:hypothetical protein